MDKIHKEIIGMSHAYFATRKVTPESIYEFIDRMKKAYSSHEIDEKLLFQKLESIHYVNIGIGSTLDDDENHEEWFNPVTNKGIKRDFKWHFWEHYREYLIKKKGWPPKVVDSIDTHSSAILSRLEDPTRAGAWDRRGMIMGYVQSGKTANYTALISKAIDTGYKLIIILAGTYDNLRSQTQSRLNEEILGYDQERVKRITGDERRLGVRKMFDAHKMIYSLTSNFGDFNKGIATQVGIFPDPGGYPILLVIKKNVSILNNVIEWVTSVIGKPDGKGNRVITNIPFLLIDDECDFASINTKKPEFDGEGKINQEIDPTQTNKLIRKLLATFYKSSYVGYTATPYANIFIHSEARHPIYGEDLFPKSFIISLPLPSNYMGPEKIFGLSPNPDEKIESNEPLPLVRYLSDNSEIIPNQHKKDLIITTLPPSMIESIKVFLLSSAARFLRKEGNPHNSMLIHVTRYTAVQSQIHELVNTELRKIVERIFSGEEMTDFKELWEKNFIPISQHMINLGYKDAIVHNWDDILEYLPKVARKVHLKLINGLATDTLEYCEADLSTETKIRNKEDVPWEDQGVTVITIGGDKLSRGLTLEGLTVSYYLRASYMYDTLMQMGRWFGYRDGYSDLCRIYTTEELASMYQHITLATKELREEIVYMEKLGKTPIEFGLKVRDHPGRLAVTSAGKSRYTERIALTYANLLSQSLNFDKKYAEKNQKALTNLVRRMGNTKYSKGEYNSSGDYLWTDIPADLIISFLYEYKAPDTIRIADPNLTARYIEKQKGKNELIQWSVLIHSLRKTKKSLTIGSLKIGCVQRNPSHVDDNSIRIGVLTEPRHEMIDLTPDERRIAELFDERNRKGERKSKIPSGKSIRYARPNSRGLLMIYIPYSEKSGYIYGEEGNEIVGYAISFPASDTAEPIEYLANTVYAQQELRNQS